MDLGFRDKTAIVTAASRGIGYACAQTLAREGANIAMCARGEKALADAADRIRIGTSARVLVQAADVTRAEDIQRLVALAVAEFGGIDVLIAIGGSPPRGSFAEIDEAQLKQGFEMTVLAPKPRDTLCEQTTSSGRPRSGSSAWSTGSIWSDCWVSTSFGLRACRPSSSPIDSHLLHVAVPSAEVVTRT